MPVYNGEPYIRGALDSLLAQTCAAFELIISDNASTDATAAICRGYAERDPRICYTRQDSNRGPIANFEAVFRRASAPHFMWAAHDDRWDPRFVEHCLAALDQDESRVMACGRWVSMSRRVPLLRIAPPQNLAFLEDDDWRRRILGYLSLSNACHKANMVYGLWRRAALEHTRLSHMSELVGTESNVGQDMALCAAALFRGKIHIVPEVLFYKLYKNAPPGHWMSRVEALVAAVARKGDRMGIRKAEQDATRQYWKLVESALVREGASQDEATAVLREALSC
jgi:cellulose synthase/poly-beta-1,6-N-acetylglucosamine synthase-like glycosyltransferase